eukprot:690004-Pelagomonas_calceolata.AAC.1
MMLRGGRHGFNSWKGGAGRQPGQKEGGHQCKPLIYSRPKRNILNSSTGLASPKIFVQFLLKGTAGRGLERMSNEGPAFI